jgi:nitrite reductase/ring-hydroxylating ferredoxin subunit
MTMNDDTRERRCGRCAGGDDRREFLRQAAFLVAGAVAGAAADAHALPVAAGEPLGVSGSELTYPIPEADGATIDRDNGVIVVRYQGKVFAFNLSCPHENAAVRWKAAVARFECSRHDSRYLPDGVYTSGRATRNMDRFLVKRNGNTLAVDVSRLIQSDSRKAEWEAAAVAL